MPPTLRDTPTFTLLRTLHRAFRRVREVDLAGIARHGLPESEFDVVMTLGNTEGLRMCEVAQRTLTSPANVTRVMKVLEEKGLVSRERGELSDREVVARLTPVGERLFAEAYPMQHRYVAAAFDAVLSREQQLALARQLEKLANLALPAATETPASRAPATSGAPRSRSRTTRKP